MITISNTQILSIANNETKVTLGTDKAIVYGGTKAQFTINSADGNEGDIITIAYNFATTKFTFRCTANPDTSGNEFRTKTTETTEEYLRYLTEFFNKNYLLSNDYEIRYLGSKIYINAKSYGDKYTILELNNSGFVTELKTTGSNQQQINFYELMLITIVSNRLSALEEVKNVQTQTINSAKQSNFDISGTLQKFCTNIFQFPVEDIIINRKEMLVKYRLRFCERFEAPPLYGPVTETEEHFYSLPGKLPKKQLDQILLEYDSLYNFFAHTKMFLTTHPGDKKIIRQQPEKLYFLFLEAGSFILHINQYNDNGEAIQNTSYTVTTAGFEIFEFNIAPYFLEMSEDTTSFKVFIKDSNGTLISEERNYIIDDSYHPYRRIFIFKNCWGVYETLLTSGENHNSLDFERNFAAINQQKLASVDFSNVFKTNTGYFDTREEYLAALEILTSDDVYLLIGNILYQAYITNKKTDAGTDNLFNYQFEIEGELEQVKHILLPSAEFNNDFSNDFNI